MPITVTYKHTADGAAILLDVYLPDGVSPTAEVPTVVYFHGGGLTLGDRTMVAPWLLSRVLAKGYLFISADYRVLPEATGHDILEDVKDVFFFITKESTTFDDGKGGPVWKVKKDAIVVTGASAGGFCAYLAAIHAEPKPVSVLSIYGVGGDFLVPFFLQPKESPALWRGFGADQPLETYSEFIHPISPGRNQQSAFPFPSSGQPTAESMIRVQLYSLYVTLGTLVDYITGVHEPSLSVSLLAALKERKGKKEVGTIVPNGVRHLLPQLNVTPAWPRTVLLHGTKDGVVPFDDATELKRLLDGQSVECDVLIAEGEDHMFDLEEDAEKKWGSIFDKSIEFAFRGL